MTHPRRFVSPQVHRVPGRRAHRCATPTYPVPMTTVIERLGTSRPGFSVEFFPPATADAERALWQAVRELEPLDPAFVSVTYGAGGSTRDRTVRTTARIAAETTLVPVAHLTAVNHSVIELRAVVGSYAGAGIRNVLAIRGDPPGDPMGTWVAHPEGVRYAEELVRLVRCLGDFCVGVAAFPYGHPRSSDLDTDTGYFLRKIRAGAQFAISQMFLRAEDFLRMRDRLAGAGCEVPVLPGLMPITNPRTLARAAEFSGAPLPAEVTRRLEPLAGDAAAFRAAGVDLATELAGRLLAEGVPGLHFYTLNRSTATRQVVARLDLAGLRA